jgi:diacylglycerol kinase family enzyme
VAAFLLVNPRAGDAQSTVDELCAESERLGIRTHAIGPGEAPAELAGAAEAEALGIDGGDGSLAAVTAVAVERDLPFVCVPYGTHNHFGRDAGLDRSDSIGALRAFSGIERRVDIGRVNGRAFLNNVSLDA